MNFQKKSQIIIPTKQDVEEYILNKKNEKEQLLKNLGGNNFNNMDDFFINSIKPMMYERNK